MHNEHTEKQAGHAVQAEQRNDGEVVALVHRAEDVADIDHHLHTLQEHDHRLNGNVRDQQLRRGDAGDQSAVPDTFGAVVDEDGRRDQRGKEKEHAGNKSRIC